MELVTQRCSYHLQMLVAVCMIRMCTFQGLTAANPWRLLRLGGIDNPVHHLQLCPREAARIRNKYPMSQPTPLVVGWLH